MLAGWLGGLVAGWWLVGGLAGWVGWAGWLVGWLGWLDGWLAGWLVGWLVGWLAGWLVWNIGFDKSNSIPILGHMTFPSGILPVCRSFYMIVPSAT